MNMNIGMGTPKPKYDKETYLHNANIRYQIYKWIPQKVLSKLSLEQSYNLFGDLIDEDPTTDSGDARQGIAVVEGQIAKNLKYSGIRYPALTELGKSLLAECKTGFDTKKEQNLLEIGAGGGDLVWKTLVAGCKTHAVDMAFFDQDASNRFDKKLAFSLYDSQLAKTKLTKTAADIFDFRKDYELDGTFDLISAQNVMHFLGPDSLIRFTEIVYNLLKPDGKAFITVQSYAMFDYQSDKSCINIYYDQKKQNYKYPGFVYREDHLRELICLPKDMSKYHDQDSYYREDITRDGETLKASYTHLFDQETMDLIFLEAGFKVLDSYYMNNAGQILPDSTGSVFVGLIVQKPDSYDVPKLDFHDEM